MTVTHTRSALCPTTRNANAACASSVTRKSAFTYDPTTGLLKTEAVEPGGSPNQSLKTTYVYDAAGNVEQLTRRGYDRAATVDRTATTAFDADRRYVTSRRNHYGHVVEHVISRNDYGLSTAVEDIDGHRPTIAYGAMGREYWRGDEVGGTTREVHRWCTPVACPRVAKFRVQTTSPGGGESLAYSTSWGVIRTATPMFNGNWSIVLKEYDGIGRIKSSVGWSNLATRTSCCSTIPHAALSRT